MYILASHDFESPQVAALAKNFSFIRKYPVDSGAEKVIAPRWWFHTASPVDDPVQSRQMDMEQGPSLK